MGLLEVTTFISKFFNSLYGINSKLNNVEIKVSDPKDIITKIFQTRAWKEKIEEVNECALVACRIMLSNLPHE